MYEVINFFIFYTFLAIIPLRYKNYVRILHNIIMCII